MSSKSRRKGFGYENKIAQLFRDNGFPNAKRHLEYQASEAQGYDLDNTGRLKIQCKRYKAYAPITKIQEVKVNDDFIPMLITKGDRQEDVAVLYLKDFIKMINDIGIIFEDVK